FAQFLGQIGSRRALHLLAPRFGRRSPARGVRDLPGRSRMLLVGTSARSAGRFEVRTHGDGYPSVPVDNVTSGSTKSIRIRNRELARSSHLVLTQRAGLERIGRQRLGNAE